VRPLCLYSIRPRYQHIDSHLKTGVEPSSEYIKCTDNRELQRDVDVMTKLSIDFAAEEEGLLKDMPLSFASKFSILHHFIICHHRLQSSSKAVFTENNLIRITTYIRPLDLCFPRKEQFFSFAERRCFCSGVWLYFIPLEISVLFVMWREGKRERDLRCDRVIYNLAWKTRSINKAGRRQLSVPMPDYLLVLDRPQPLGPTRQHNFLVASLSTCISRI